MIRRQLLPALIMVIVFTVITGVLYPLVVTGIAQGIFGDKANGSLVERDGRFVGSALIGQPFSSPEYFHPRPSAAGYGPGPGYSFGSNFGPTNETFLDGVDSLVRAYREMNGLEPDAPVPVDAVTSSGSGLDPHISVANARVQAVRVAENRGLIVDQVMGLVVEHTEGRGLGFLGEPGVNVLLLNLALDDLAQ